MGEMGHAAQVAAFHRYLDPPESQDGTPEPCAWGIKWEDYVRELYQALEWVEWARDCGSFTGSPNLVASPDGLVRLRNGTMGLLEIKCPYSLQLPGDKCCCSRRNEERNTWCRDCAATQIHWPYVRQITMALSLAPPEYKFVDIVFWRPLGYAVPDKPFVPELYTQQELRVFRMYRDPDIYFQWGKIQSTLQEMTRLAERPDWAIQLETWRHRRKFPKKKGNPDLKRWFSVVEIPEIPLIPGTFPWPASYEDVVYSLPQVDSAPLACSSPLLSEASPDGPTDPCPLDSGTPHTPSPNRSG